MSALLIMERWAAVQATSTPQARADLAAVTARCWAFHGMSLALARMVDQGRYPVLEAAMLKEMGTRFEQGCVDIILRYLGRAPDPNSSDPDEMLLARAVLTSPSWTIRGGTTEILRTVVARGNER